MGTCKLRVCTNEYLKNILRNPEVKNKSNFEEKITAGYNAYRRQLHLKLDNKFNPEPATSRMQTYEDLMNAKIISFKKLKLKIENVQIFELELQRLYREREIARLM